MGTGHSNPGPLLLQLTKTDVSLPICASLYPEDGPLLGTLRAIRQSLQASGTGPIYITLRYSLVVVDAHTNGTRDLLHDLAEFRYHLRKFLKFSEEAAGRHGLQPQQHQLLLQIVGAPPGVVKTIAYFAERLGLRHHSVVQLSKRCEDAGLIKRSHTEDDRRWVVLELTAKGKKTLDRLSEAHAQELAELAPQLIKDLSRISTSVRTTKSKRKEENED